MAPRDKYQVHSLHEHVKKTKANAAGTTQKTLASRPAPTIKKEANDSPFSKKDASDDSSSSSEDDSDDEESGAKFLNQLKKKNGTPASNNSKRLSKDDEIADSDVERKASAKKTKQNGGGAPVKPEPETSDTSSEGESDSDDEAQPKKVIGGEAKASDSSTDTSEEESSESEDDEEGPIEKAAKQPVEPKAVESDAESDSSSEESSDDDNEDAPETAKPEAAPMPNGTPANTTTTSTSAEESSSEGSSSDDDDEEDEQADVSMHIADREDNRGVPTMIAPDYVVRRSDQGLDGKDVAKVCSQANLEGKQLWYFTVPTNVPVSVVQNLEIQVDSAQRGDRVFSHDGEDYGISFNPNITKSTIQILVPSANGPEYQSANRQIDQVMQVKRLPQLGAPASQANVQAAPPTAARPQPKGLRARFKPIGVHDPAPSQKDVEMTEAPAVPTSGKEDKKAAKAAAKAEKKAKKYKKGEDIVEVPSTQEYSQESVDPASLKRKITSSEEDAELAAEQLMGESSAAASKRKKQKTERAASPELGSEPASTQAAETPAKKAKKEKKEKKDKKAAAATPASNLTLAPPSSTLKKQTPVPIPKFPGSSQLNLDTIPSSQPTPTAKKEKKEKKTKKGTAADVSKDERKTTPVPLPRQGSSS